MEVQLQPSPQLGRRGSDARTAAIQLAAASAGRKITVISFHFLRRRPPCAKQKRSQPLCSCVGSKERGGVRPLLFPPATQAAARRTAGSFFCSQLQSLAATGGESCQAFSGIDPARLWLAGGQKTKYFLLLRLGKEI